MADTPRSLDTSRNSIDELLAPSLDESTNRSVEVNEADHVQLLEKDRKSARSAVKQDTANDTEEKKVDDPAEVEDPSDDLEFDAENTNSFELALGEIENEFETEFGNSVDEDSPSSPPHERTPAKHMIPTSPTDESPINDPDILRTASSPVSDGMGAINSTFETSRYNNILGLLRNRREELAAALQKEPPVVAIAESESNEEIVVSKKEPTWPVSNVEKGNASDSVEDDGGSPNKAKDKLKLEKIEPTPEEIEESRRRQLAASPTPRNPTDARALSPTPPRSPRRSLPYFHKPSGTTPPASPLFPSSTGNSPSRKARPETSPSARSDGSATPPVPTDNGPRQVPAEKTSSDLPTLPPLSMSKTSQPDEQEPSQHLETPSVLRSSNSPSHGQQEADAAADSATSVDKKENVESTPAPQSPARADESNQSFVSFSPNSSPARRLNADAARMATAPTPQRKTVSNRSGRQSPRKAAPPDKIRFRDPYPILRPEKQPRDPKEIIAQHAVPRDHSPIRWVRPKPDLKQLIVAAMGPSLPRRSNACGALKVLTMSKKNQINLLRTDSFLSSIVFCASQDISVREKDVALDARTRALTCLKNVCEPKMNRNHIVTFPGLLDCLTKAIETDDGESRALACGALAFIAKTAECREEIVKDFRLVKLLALVLGNRAPVLPLPTTEEKKEDHSTSPHPQDISDHTFDDDEDSEPTTPVGEDSREESREESTIGDYDTAFAGSLSLLESFDIMSATKSFDMLSGAKSPMHFSDRDEEEEEEEASVDDASYESEPDQPAMESIRQKNLERSQIFVRESRASACAVLLHLSRECGLSQALCNNRTVLENMLMVANETANPIHTRCLEFLFNLTRFPTNNAMLTPYDGMVATLLSLGSSDVTEDRLIALQTLQNLSSDQSSKAKLAVDSILTFLTGCAVRRDDAEREAAVSTLQNISTEPGAVVAITNTKNAIATLVHLAHSPSTKPSTRQLACETLANISLWLQTLAGTGKVPEGVENTPLPTLKTSGWQKWD